MAVGYEHCQHCGRAHYRPRTVLVDGVELCTYSEAWRFECEVRWALKLPDKARKPKVTKLQYLINVEAQRGIDAKNTLRNEMLRRYKNAKTKA